ncbi:UDP-glucose 4-epimerase [Polystyrenella longa]|uniref:UDP-glucose 4-epimerase n=1 Tax=Polystyrenella longa TaxID=2528007 RepID=A0A518CKP3_9PLAN|nr:NAD-dependent epimerase/dehydratase family protein [Polystyrenella longa]QDU79754.1 UDP-glucose 4-epimerase [Polystyrenella longa]
MRVLVTGGAGFIGGHIVDALLEAGHTPLVVDNFSAGDTDNLPSHVEVFDVDIRNREELTRVFVDCQPDAVSHHAAQLSVSRSVREPAFDAEVNILGWLNVLEAAAKQDVNRILFASSGGTYYGNIHQPATEDLPPRPESPYGFTKLTGEHYLEFFTRQHPGLTGVSLRYSNVYGPRQSSVGEAGVIAIFASRLLQAESVVINGDGSALRDFVYVTDVARANLLALEGKLDHRYRAYNIGTGQGTTISQLADTLSTFATEERANRQLTEPIPLPQYGPPRAGDIHANLIDSSRIRQELGWTPEVDVKTGLQQTTRWFAERVFA